MHPSEGMKLSPEDIAMTSRARVVEPPSNSKASKSQLEPYPLHSGAAKCDSKYRRHAVVTWLTVSAAPYYVETIRGEGWHALFFPLVVSTLEAHTKEDGATTQENSRGRRAALL